MSIDLEPGTILAGYRIESRIGRGGMGVVYRATQLGLDRQVALKLITPELADDEDFRSRFERESRTAASIDHPNVIPVYEAGEDAGRLFITMRYVEGSDLKAQISSGRFDPERAARIVAQVGSALDAAHARGLVHRDVKPANVLLAGTGVDEHAYLTDFGLTKRAGSQSGPTRTGQWVGTLDYVAPEQIQGQRVDARTDVYALGCVLYQALSGRIPFSRESDVAKMWAHINDAPPELDRSLGLPAALDAVIRRAMAKDPDERFPSAGDLGLAAKAAAAGAAPAAPERSVATGAAAPTAVAEPTPTQVAGTEIGAVPAGPTELAGAPAAPPAAAATPRKPPADPSPPGGAGRRPLVLALLAALVVGAVIALVAGGVLSGDDEGGGDQAAPTDAGPGTAGARPVGVPGPLSDDALQLLVDEFVRFYAAGDTDALAGLFTANFTQEMGEDGEEQDRDAAIRGYQEEIEQLEDPLWQFPAVEVQVDRATRLGNIDARFEVTNAGNLVRSGVFYGTASEQNGRVLFEYINLIPNE